MRFNKAATLYFLLILFSIFCNGQETPPIQNYTAKEYGGENQNWSISQSQEKYIYVANNSGLLEFNGAKWKLYPSPNNTIIRSVNVIDEKIYTGSYMEFGVWQKNAFGILKYTSLSSTLKEPLIEEEFWNILNFDNYILFQSLYRIYIYNLFDKSFKIINSKTNLPKVFKVNKSIYFQIMNEGLYEIENGKPILISNSTIFKEAILVNIFLNDENKLLFQTQNKGFFYLNEEGIPKWEIQFNEKISALSVYSSIQLADGGFIIGTISNGIYHIDRNGNILSNINQENGLNNNTVLSIFEDSSHNIWLGLDHGISVINFNSEFKEYNDIYGKLGAVYASAIYNNKLYLGTNQGLFYKNYNSSEEFSFVKGTNGQVWFLKVIDNNLFCGHNSGTFIINHTNINLIANKMGTWNIKPIPGKPNLLIQGNYDGLHILEKNDNNWQYRNKLKGFDISSRYFEFESEKSLFISHEYKGVIKLKIDDNYTKALEFLTDASVPKGLKSSLITFNNNILYTSKEGVLKYDSKTHKFLKDSILTTKLYNGENYISGKLEAIETTNTLWGFTKNNIIYFSQGKLNNVPMLNKISLPAILRNSIPGFENVTHLKNQEYLFGTSKGYIILNLNNIKKEEFEVNINSIEKSILNHQKNSVSYQNHTFKFNENNLYFSFSVPNVDKYAEINYQYQLEGIYDSWSSWSPESEASFKNLPFGNYTFKVRAKKGNVNSINEATFEFTIQRPWYLSNLMLFAYLVLFICVFLLVHLFYKKYYTKQKQRFLEQKQREFSVSQLENEKVIMRLKNDKLQNEIESKSRELAASTMSIIKKNELLNTIKNELEVVKEDSKVKPVIKIINKNLTNNSDWEMFQEAFNTADSDFLKKVKAAHPNLTPNDLRLCAYLRLNLASKEIAPLLNISARSVEIKRYRLRKKMELLHEKSLVEYILEL